MQIPQGSKKETTACRETNLSFKTSLIYILAGFCSQWTLKNQEPKSQIFLEMPPSTMVYPHLMPDPESLVLFCSVV